MTWARYYRLEPWDETRADMRAGIIASVIANVAAAFGKNKKRFKPRDFIVEYDKPPQSPQQMIAMLTLAARAAKASKQKRNGKSNDRQTVGNIKSE